MNEKDFIPGIKYTTKEDLKKALDQKEEALKQCIYSNELLQERLYESGVEKRPTIMTQIIEKESSAWKTIKYIIIECEKETGRPFPIIITHTQLDF